MKSWRSSSTRIRELTVLSGLVLALAGLSLCFGGVAVSPAAVWRALCGAGGSDAAARIVRYVYFPRTCGCLLAGGALACSGAIIQNVLANPLAAPNLIGVNAGAGLMVALSCALFPEKPCGPLAAFLGALAGVLLVLSVARRTGASRFTVVLTGAAVSSIFGAGIDAVITFVPEALSGYSDFRVGGLFGVTMARVIPAAWVILPTLAAAFALGSEMDVLMLGTDTAQSLGLRVRSLRLVLLTLAAALAGAAVSFAGLLGFVGLIVPHIMRRLAGGESRYFLLASALGGAALLTGCDLLARVLFAPYELPVGIVLSFLGGPFFLWLLLRQRGGRTF